MTMMRESDGETLPNNGPDHKHDNCWDIAMWGDGILSLTIPMFFDAGDGGVYSGAGAVIVELRDLLQEYLNDCDGLDNGKGLRPLAAMLREFAEKYEAEATELCGGTSGPSERAPG